MFQVCDFLSNPPRDTFDLLLDKGTYDAISLMSDSAVACAAYRNSLKGVMDQGSKFMLVTCNFTRVEVEKDFGGELVETMVEYVNESSNVVYQLHLRFVLSF